MQSLQVRDLLQPLEYLPLNKFVRPSSLIIQISHLKTKTRARVEQRRLTAAASKQLLLLSKFLTLPLSDAYLQPHMLMTNVSENIADKDIHVY